MFNAKVAFSVLFMLSLMGCGSGGNDSNTSASLVVSEGNVNEVDSVEGGSEVIHLDVANDELVTVDIAKVVAVPQAEVYVEPPVAANIEMDELVASDDFTFSSKETITVALDLSDTLALNGQSELRARVAIYSEYTLLSNGQFYPTAKKQVIAGDLDNGQFNSSFTRLKGQSMYLIDVWFYNGDLPIQLEKTIVANTLTW